MANSDKLLDERHEALMDAIQGVHTRLDTLNGRTRVLENMVAVLKWAYGIGGVVLAWVFANFMRG